MSAKMNDNDLKLLSEMLSEVISSDSIADVAESISFKGFDPLVIYKDIGDLIRSNSTNKDHLLVMIVFGLTRGFGGGKTWQNILDRTNPAGRETLKNAYTALQVKLTRPNDEKTVTVPRLMQVFSVYTYRIFCILVSAGKIRAFNYKGDLPQRLCWIGSPSCMDANSWNKWSDEYVSFSVHCSKVWNRPQDESTARRFAELAYSNATWPSDKRIRARDLKKPLITEPESEDEDEEKGKKKEKKEGKLPTAETAGVAVEEPVVTGVEASGVHRLGSS